MTFQQYIHNNTPCKVSLPIIHCTNSKNFISVINNNELKPKYCDVFDEPLLYFFYGRPAYKVSSKCGIRNEYALLPTCFIFNSKCLKNIKRIFPFDTGAFSKGIYQRYISDDFNLNDFILNNIDYAPERFITTFFGNNRNYYYGEVKNNLSMNFSEMAIQVYYHLIKSNGENIQDDRSFTMEIQTEEEIQVGNFLEAVVLPSRALDDNIVKDYLDKWNVEPLTYSLFAGSKPFEYNYAIKFLLEKYLIQKNLI